MFSDLMPNAWQFPALTYQVSDIDLTTSVDRTCRHDPKEISLCGDLRGWFQKLENANRQVDCTNSDKMSKTRT
jgi:hypothetical protein